MQKYTVLHKNDVLANFECYELQAQYATLTCRFKMKIWKILKYAQ